VLDGRLGGRDFETRRGRRIERAREGRYPGRGGPIIPSK